METRATPASAVDDRTSIFTLLEHRGIRVARFAELIDYSYDYVHSIRTGRRPITQEFRRRCVQYFQMPEALLFVAGAETNDDAPLADAPDASHQEAEVA